MKIKSLLEQYQASLKAFNITMPIAATIFFVAGLINVFKPSPSLWLGIMFIGLGLVFVVIFLVATKYLRKVIKELQEERNDDDKKY